MGSTPASAAAVLRNQGLQFVRMLQGALRLVSLYSADHNQCQAMIQRAMKPLEAVLKDTPNLSIGFQFDKVLLNSMPVSDPSLAPLAAELVKRRIGFLVISEGIDEYGLARLLTVLATRPETIEEKGGLAKFLRANPLDHARIVGIEMAAAEGTLAVITSAEEAAAMSRIPRWLLRALQDVQAEGATQVVGAQELATLANTLAPDLTPEQRLLMPQLQDLLVRVVQRANTAALGELIRSAAIEIGGAGEELLQSVLLQGLVAAAEAGEQPQAERILRSVTELRLQPESLLQMVPAEKMPQEVANGLGDYIRWLARPLDERLAELNTTAGGREFRWLVLEIEQELEEGKNEHAAELLLSVYGAGGPPVEAERAEALTRARYMLAELCSGGMPPSIQSILEVIANRLRDETSLAVSTPLIESLVTLTQAGAEKHEYAVATAAATVVAEIAEEFSPRGRAARQAQSRLLKPATLHALVKTCVLKKDDPAVNRSILPLLKRVGDGAARELLTLLEKEPIAARRLRTLQVIKLLGKAAAGALSEKIADPQWFVVRNAVAALAELADPALLDYLEPALSHPDHRVQQAAVSAVLKTQSPQRGVQLSRALSDFKPAVLETVLDDLLVLKEPQAVTYLEKLIRRPNSDIRPQLLQKAVAALWAINTEDAVYSLVDCAEDHAVPLPLRQAAVRALARMEAPAARQALADFVEATPEAALADEGRKLLQS